MAMKRKAQEAFERPQGQLSAFAAAKLARQSGNSSPSKIEPEVNGDILAVEAANTPYDGHHSGAVTPNAAFVEDELVSTSPITPPKARLSTFALNASNLVREDEQSLEISLKRDETVTILGEYDVTVLDNRCAIAIAGTVRKSQHGSTKVYASSTQALPQIRSLSDHALIRISTTNSGLRKLERLSPLFRNIWNSKSSHSRHFCLLSTSDEDGLKRPLYALDIEKDMDTILRAISSKSTSSVQKPRIITLGAKSSGKSTFNKLLCNYFYTFTKGNRLLYLDIDPGQPEFSPPGQISLVEIAAPILGPSFTHPAWPHLKDFRMIRSHAIAATSFKDDPEHYKACVMDLFSHADKGKPIIVNACGWVTGTGASVAAELLSILEISNVVLLEPLEESLITSLKSESPRTEFHRTPRCGPKPSSRTPAEMRAMQTMSYFHRRPESAVSASRWSGKSINTVRPWIVSYARDKPGIKAIMSYGQSPDSKFLAEVLDGSIVAITTIDAHIDRPFLEDVAGATADAGSVQLLPSSNWTPEDIPFVGLNDRGINLKLNPRTSQCIGLALVRGIDPERKEIHLVTPLLDSQIADLENKQVVLIRGGFDQPEWAYLEDLYKAENAASNHFDNSERPWVSTQEMAGIEGSVWRLRHPPVASAAAGTR